jgi:hypothetical protein
MYKCVLGQICQIMSGDVNYGLCLSDHVSIPGRSQSLACVQITHVKVNVLNPVDALVTCSQRRRKYERASVTKGVTMTRADIKGESLVLGIQVASNMRATRATR